MADQWIANEGCPDAYTWRMIPPQSADDVSRPRAGRPGRTFSLARLMTAVTITALLISNVVSISRWRQTRQELDAIRREAGYLPETSAEQLAAIRMPVDEPLTYRFRVRVPGREPYQLAYGTLLPKGQRVPDWYSMMAVPAGESIVTIRVAKDPRDEIWKISTIVRGVTGPDERSDSSGASGRNFGVQKPGTRRMWTVLPESHVEIFRRSHDVVSTGVSDVTVAVNGDVPLRLLDERWLIGESSLLMYGDRGPDEDQIGVYAQLQNPNP